MSSRNGSQKISNNLQYLQEIERKEKMSRIIDPMGMPVGGNNQPRQAPPFDPVLQMLWPIFAQTVHDILTADTRNRLGRICELVPVCNPREEIEIPPVTLEEVVETAWEVANRAFNRLGFEFVFPLGARAIRPPTQTDEVPEETKTDNATA